MTRRSIINGAVEFIPRKTKDGRHVVVRVPLLKDALEILDRYKDLPGDAILPLISQQKYNVAIKKILQHAGITRSVVWLNPTTGEPEVRPIYEVMSSLRSIVQVCCRRVLLSKMQLITPLLDMGYLEPTEPDKPKSPKQKYCKKQK